MITEHREFKRRNNTGLILLSDPSRDTIKKYGIFNPDDAAGVFPSIFILDKEGRIRWMYIGKDAADRPGIEVVLDALKKVP